MKNKDQKFILFLGRNGFPFGSAGVNHSAFISKAIQESGLKILIISHRAVHRKSEQVQIDMKGEVQGVPYQYTTLSPYKYDSFIARNLNKIYGRINEFFLILKFKLTGKLKAFLIYLHINSIRQLIYYRFLSKIFFIPLVLFQTEFYSEIERNAGIFEKIGDKLFDKYSYYLTDKYLLISEFLISKVFYQRKVKPYVKIPPLIDPGLFNNLEKKGENNFVFCATTPYMEVIFFVIEAFELLEDSTFKLVLIVNGDEQSKEKLKKRIQKSKKNQNILQLSKLPYETLLDYYLNAAALLIPLRPIIQDEARFPQKISEYSISGSPIITTKHGEVVNYFEDNISALIAEKYDIALFSKKMEYVIKCPEQAKKIGIKGKEIGMKYFNYKQYSKTLHDFLVY